MTWRQRYRHPVDAPINQASDALRITDDHFVPVVVKTQPQVVSVTPLPASPTKPVQICEITIGRTRLRLSGTITPAMLSTPVRELKRGPLVISLLAGSHIWLVSGVTDMRNGLNVLASSVQNTLNDNPFEGHIFNLPLPPQRHYKNAVGRYLHTIGLRDPRGRKMAACLEVKYRRITALPPIGTQKKCPAQLLTVIHAQEQHIPDGLDRIE